GLLRALADLPDAILRQTLESLQSAEFLYEGGLDPDLEYAFKHALTHEVTYGGLPPARRRELHARIVAAIETWHQDQLAEHTERLAHHALRASSGRRPRSISARRVTGRRRDRRFPRRATISSRRSGSWRLCRGARCSSSRPSRSAWSC